jgi:DNA-binding CsgD family transcriptional regulator
MNGHLANAQLSSSVGDAPVASELTTPTSLLCADLNDLFLADDPAERLLRLKQCLQQRGAAGAAHAVLDPRSEGGVSLCWIDDFSGVLDGLPKPRVGRQIFDSTPRALVNWMFGRRVPFWLASYTRFIPYSADAILAASAPQGRRKLRDFVLIPHPRKPGREAMFIGLLEVASRVQAEELATLGSAYFMSDTGTARPPPVALNERQIACLRGLVRGQSVKQVARANGFSYSNARYHIERAKAMTGFGSVQQLIAYAAQHYALAPEVEAPGQAEASTALR